MNFRAHILFSGTVQGVGFRYTTRHFATQLGLKGWVRNLPDGRVEILAEGGRGMLEELSDHLKKRFDGFIKDQQIDFTQSEPHYKSFEIVHP